MLCPHLSKFLPLWIFQNQRVTCRCKGQHDSPMEVTCVGLTSKVTTLSQPNDGQHQRARRSSCERIYPPLCNCTSIEPRLASFLIWGLFVSKCFRISQTWRGSFPTATSSAISLGEVDRIAHHQPRYLVVEQWFDHSPKSVPLSSGRKTIYCLFSWTIVPSIWLCNHWVLVLSVFSWQSTGGNLY